MKVEQFIVQYLYNNKSLSIPEMGVFTIADGVILPDETIKEQGLPTGAIQFEYNTKAEQDEGLIDFIVAETRKVRSLATSDLESYIILSRQFLNIGKPLVIDGLGTLVKNQQGTYEFTQGSIANPKMEPRKADIKEKIQDEISFSSQVRPVANKQVLILGLVVFFAISAAAALYYFLWYNNDSVPITLDPSTVQESIPAQNSQPAAISPSVISTIDSQTSISSSNPVDGYTFKVQIKQYDTREAATRAYDRLTSYGHQLLLQQKDSTSFEVVMPFSTAISDTARAKDSIRILFGGKPVIVQ